MPAIVQLVDPSDTGAVRRAAELLHAFNREFDTPTPGAAVLAERLRRDLGGAMFVVLVDEPAVGLAVVSLRPNLWFEGPVALLDELYVAPPHRNRGLGSAMIHAVRAEAARRGAEYLEINVDEGDVDAQRFYARHGFSVTDPDSGERALYWSGPTAPTT